MTTIIPEGPLKTLHRNRAIYPLMGILGVDINEARHLLAAVEAAQTQSLVETGSLWVGNVVKLTIGLNDKDELFIKRSFSKNINKILEIEDIAKSPYAFLDVIHINRLKQIKEKLRDKISEDNSGELQDD